MFALLTVWLLSSTPCPPGEIIEGGEHSRLTTPRGAVHLWCRSTSEPTSIVVYVHGYRDDVDSAFSNHHLAGQFAKSKSGALFLAVQAPSGPGQPVVFDDFDELLALVGAPAGVPVLVVGHSGGNRTLKAWLTSPRVNEVVLLDGFYGDTSLWRQWLVARPEARLRMVGQATWEKAEAWRMSLPVALREQVSHESARCGHMDIVTQGDWLPSVVRQSRSASAQPLRI